MTRKPIILLKLPVADAVPCISIAPVPLVIVDPASTKIPYPEAELCEVPLILIVPPPEVRVELLIETPFTEPALPNTPLR